MSVIKLDPKKCNYGNFLVKPNFVQKLLVATIKRDVKNWRLRD